MAVFTKYFGASGLYVAGLFHNGIGALSVWRGVESILVGLAIYAAVSLAALGSLFVLRKCDSVIGKDPRTGQIPFWSYLVFWPFHSLNLLAITAKRRFFRSHIQDATHIIDNLYIGGWFADLARDQWSAILDLTTEFPERGKAEAYLNIATWDGNPPSVEKIEQGARFLAQHNTRGPTLCHCASGIGRSTTVLCAALVVAGKANDYKEAYQLIKSRRQIVRLNGKMLHALEQWETWRRQDPQKNEDSKKDN